MEKLPSHLLIMCQELENLEKQINDLQLIADEKKKEIMETYYHGETIEYFDIENNKILSFKNVETKGSIDYVKFIKERCSADQTDLLEQYRKETRNSVRYSFKEFKKEGK